MPALTSSRVSGLRRVFQIRSDLALTLRVAMRQFSTSSPWRSAVKWNLLCESVVSEEKVSPLASVQFKRGSRLKTSSRPISCERVSASPASSAAMILRLRVNQVMRLLALSD